MTEQYTETKARSRALLLVGHGAQDDERPGRPVRRHAERLRSLPDFDEIRVAFWDEDPAVEGAIERCKAREVVVAPVFMSHGYYAGRVIPKALGLEIGSPGEIDRHAGKRVVYTEALGTHPGARRIVGERIREEARKFETGPLKPEGITVVLAGHGTPKHDESRTSTERMVDRLHRFGVWGEVAAGFMDEAPAIEAVVRDAACDRVVVVPYFVADGPHVAEEIPAMLGADDGRTGFPREIAGKMVAYAQPVGTAPDAAKLIAGRAREGIGRLEGSRPEPQGWPIRRLMSEVVGSGPRTSSDMTREQASEAMRRILDGRPASETLGGFWLANRWKKNTPEELAAFLDVLDERSAAPGDERSVENSIVDCGANYDGKRSTLLLGVAAGLVSAEAGAPVAVHSAGPVPTKEGVTYRDVLKQLGVALPGSPAESDAMLEEYGFGFFDRRQFHPQVAGLLESRRRLGVRTFMNTIETLTNPGRARIHLGSFYHLAFATRVIDAIRASESSRFERVVMFQGLEGYDDVRPGSTKVVEWEGDEITDFDLETGELGFGLDRDDLRREDLAVASARETEAVLAGGGRGAVYDAVCLNAAVRLFAAGLVDTPSEGVDRAREAIAGGGAGERLERLARQE